MMNQSLEHFVGTVVKSQRAEEEERPEHEVIKVSETVSAAATAYETVRNSLEYDEEHRLRQNAIHRILKRRVSEGVVQSLAGDLLRELIWARYLPNKEVPERMIGVIDGILAKYQVLINQVEEGSKNDQRNFNWILDLLATEIEYTLKPPIVDESLASFAYQELRERIEWSSNLIPEEDRDLQLYVAVHRTVLKSNMATLRFRVLTLYYPEWLKASSEDPVVHEVAGDLETVIESVNGQLDHPGSDSMYKLIRKHAVVFHVLKDLVVDNPDAFAVAVESGNIESLEKPIAKAAKVRYERFRVRLRRSVFRAVLFLFFSKLLLAVIMDLPVKIFTDDSDYTSLVVNVLFHPILLAVIGMTVRIPESKNTKKITEEIAAILGTAEDFQVVYKVKRPWSRGPLRHVFNLLYVSMFLIVIGLISAGLTLLNFDISSISTFILFLSLVMFIGLRIRNTKRELVIVETGTGILGTLVDIIFLPIIRTGRWISLHAPRINVFLFFFDFIIEAPFKATIKLGEGWLAFLREKKEDI